MLVARTLSPRSCTAILASASSRDRGMTFSLAYISGSNCFAMLATFATSGIRLVFHGCSNTQLSITVAIVIITFRRVLVNICMPFAKVDIVSSIGAVRNSVSPLIAKRTTASVSVNTPLHGATYSRPWYLPRRGATRSSHLLALLSHPPLGSACATRCYQSLTSAPLAQGFPVVCSSWATQGVVCAMASFRDQCGNRTATCWSVVTTFYATGCLTSAMRAAPMGPPTPVPTRLPPVAVYSNATSAYSTARCTRTVRGGCALDRKPPAMR